MTKIRMLGVVGALLIASAGMVSAHGTACCNGFACPAGQTAVPGETPEAAQCCTDPADPSTCTATANAGWACNSDPAANAEATPERGAIAGCVDGELGVCVGGAASPAGEPEGCVGLGAAFVAENDPGATAEDCTAAAVAACCAHGACVPHSDEE